jgi:hypothetical protein
VLPYQRLSGAQPLLRTGWPQPTTSNRLQAVAFSGLKTTQLWTEKMPFQRPVRPVKTSRRASRAVAAGGSMPVLDQSASRKLAGRSLPA